MRLVCPNCAAQYEVADNAIPVSGRNVQCANCENTWFQNHESAETKEPAPSGRRNLRKARQKNKTAAEQSPEEILAAEAAAGEDGQDNGPRAGIKSEEAPTVDQSVLDILRKEAELDAQARNSKAPPQNPAVPEPAVNTAPEPPVSNTGTTRSARSPRPQPNRTRERERRLNVSATDAEQTPDIQSRAAPVRPPRGKARNESELPDVDHLNSTLRSADDKSRPADAGDDYTSPRKGGAGRFGFYLAVFIALLMVAAYQLEVQIVQALPETEVFMTEYVTQVDRFRLMLDEAAASVREGIINLMERFL